jgi:hypothetical protein
MDSYQHDVFICHASEDKESVARPLAKALRDQRVAVWYDEFSLRLGDSLRQAIDKGLASARFGIVILSPSFFKKGWTSWELDGLLQKDLAGGTPVLLPVWHDITIEDVSHFSPSLAGRLAVPTSAGIDNIVKRILEVVQPAGSSLIIAQRLLHKAGADAPPVTDDWWLDVAAFSAGNPVEGTFQDASGWGRWGFPLPPASQAPEERGRRLAQAALQMSWQQEADFRKISQITHPSAVLEFIHEMPGLLSTCHKWPEFLACYAPQLTISGFGGPFESSFEKMYQESLVHWGRKSAAGSTAGSALTTSGSIPTCGELLALRDPHFGNYEPAIIACHYVQGDIHGPEVRFHEYLDYIAWFLSNASNWLPPSIRDYLVVGMAQWEVWFSDHTNKNIDKAWQALESKGERNISRMARTLREDPNGHLQTGLRDCFEEAIISLQLPDTANQLLQRFCDRGFLGNWPERRSRRKKSYSK